MRLFAQISRRLINFSTKCKHPLFLAIVIMSKLCFKFCLLYFLVCTVKAVIETYGCVDLASNCNELKGRNFCANRVYLGASISNFK
jgi:hypothetical protein